MKIRMKLTLALLAASLLPLLAFVISAGNEARLLLAEEIGRSHQLLARDKALAIATLLDRRVEEAVALARHPHIVQAAITADAANALRPEQERQEEVARIDRAWIAAKGRTEAARRILDNESSRFLIEYKERDPLEYGELFITDRHGAALAMTAPLTDYYQADEGWWREGFAGGAGSVYIDDRGMDLSAGSVVTGVVAPIRHDGMVVGILKINFRMSHIPSVIANPYAGVVPGGEELDVTLMRSRGNAVFDSSRGGHETASHQEMAIMAGGQDSGWTSDSHHGPETIQGFSRIEPASPIFSRIVGPEAYRGVSGEGWGETAWYVFIHRPSEAALLPLAQLRKAALYAIGILVAMVLVLAFSMGATISKPLLALRAGVKAVADGNLSYRTGLSRRDEIGELSRDFDRMTATLRETMTGKDALEQRVQQRTAELDHRNRELETLVKELEGFSYSVSHDLRAPLRAIDGFIAILTDEYGEKLDVEGRRLFGIIADNARKMGELIDDILALSRAGRMELVPLEVDMNRLVDEIWQELAGQHRDRELRFRRAELPAVCCAPNALRQVLEKLLENALKFTRDQSPAVITVSGETEGDEVRYRISDNGAGFNPEYGHKLFTLFERLHGIEEFEGSGVGLPVAQRLVQRMGGSIRGEGSMDGGASFEFTLPLHPRSQAGSRFDNDL